MGTFSSSNPPTLRELLERLDRIELRLSTVESSQTALQKTLMDQAAIAAALSKRAIESEANMQRLISAVEKLCDRADSRGNTMAGTLPPLPFERHLGEAVQRQPEPPPPQFQPDINFRARIIKEEEGKVRHRKPLTRL